jgi:hypothetical protein
MWAKVIERRGCSCRSFRRDMIMAFGQPPSGIYSAADAA